MASETSTPALHRVAAVVVLFFPDTTVVDRLREYARIFDRVVVIDNTDHVGHGAETPPELVGVHWERNGTNEGVARALNRGIRIAASSDFKWVMLLDQDSTLSRETAIAVAAGMAPSVGIVAPVQATKARDATRVAGRHGFRDVRTTMTSGSLLNIAAFEACGEFDEKLFIDHVDNEYCLRLIQRGYRVTQCLHAVLSHSLGEVHSFVLAGRRFEYTRHAPFRLYFFVRNGLHVSSKYLVSSPRFALSFGFRCAIHLARTVLLDPAKLERLAMMRRGFFDWIGGRYGRRHV